MVRREEGKNIAYIVMISTHNIFASSGAWRRATHERRLEVPTIRAPRCIEGGSVPSCLADFVPIAL